MSNTNSFSWLVLAILLIYCCCCNTVISFRSMQQITNSTQQALATTTTTKFELKFQSELDNSTIFKQERAQQIFKCQVRLAPVNPNSGNSPAQLYKHRFNSRTWPLQMNKSLIQDQRDEITWNSSFLMSSKWPQNVTLTIRWLKDDHQLEESFLPESVAVVEVEFKGGSNNNTYDKSSSSSSITTNNHTKKQKQPRIEVKNTLNVAQMKLSSRLKLSQLKVTDSGSYRCIARGTFVSISADDSTQAELSKQLVVADVGLQKEEKGGDRQHHHSPFLAGNEQTLNSNEANLMVLARALQNNNINNNNNSQTFVGAGGEKGFTHSNSNSNNNNNNNSNNNNRRASYSRNNVQLQLQQQQQQQQSNDMQHAIGRSRNSNNNNNFGQRGRANDFAAGVALTPNSEGNQRQRAQLMGSQDNNDYEGPNRKSAPQANHFSANNNNNNNFLSHQQHSLQSNELENYAGGQGFNNQFEDDEDLFRLAGNRIEFISGQLEQQANDSSESSSMLFDGFLNSEESSSSLIQSVTTTSSDGFINNVTSSGELSLSPTLENNNNSPPPSTQKKQSPHRETNNNLNDDESVDYDYDGSPINSNSNSNNNINNNNFNWLNQLDTQNHHLGKTPPPSTLIDSTKTKFVRLVHKTMALPELSCYTGTGDHYRGNVSSTLDGRSCLKWSQVKRLATTAKSNGALGDSVGSLTELIRGESSLLKGGDQDDHKHCRNPSSNPHGPWCFVLYNEQFDGLIQELQDYIVLSPSRASINKQQEQTTRTTTNGITKWLRIVVPRQCSISACSEYLWFYVVAPPAGLLIVLSCLITILIRSIRRSHYNSLLFAKSNSSIGHGTGLSSTNGKRSSALPKQLNRFIRSGASVGALGGKFAPRKFSNSTSKRSCGRYLDDDIFDIVDDIDWSDGNQTQSPKSTTTESLKLNSSSFASSSLISTGNQLDVITPSSTRHKATKSSSQMFGDHPKTSANDKDPQDLLGNRSSSPQAAVTQVGPMFATLRCQIRSKISNNHHDINGKHLAGGNNKSSTFIDQTFQSDPNKQNKESNLDWFKNGTVNPNDNHQPEANNNQTSSASHSPSSPQTNSKADHLISCSTTTESLNSTATSSEKFIKANELPQLNPISLSPSLNEPFLYEGKFSQVYIAHMQQQQTSSKLNCKDTDSSGSFPASGPHLMGSRVAIFSLKSTASIDPTIFDPSELKLRNLNHLNLLKLIGTLVQSNNMNENCLDESELEFINNNNKSTKLQQCSLIFDMSQLVDLSDWLKQQSKDSLVSNEPGNDLGVRRNLTCLTKQIALGIDYLHDRGVIYKDLACRNCFLDPTKMLVKLASFNIELILPTNNQSNSSHCDDKMQNLKSMVRPSYLHDYYVIDSRPIECQLLPLSWIPLESILFNKFNKQTDIWSFGCLIYELFSLGEVAYFGYSSKQVIDAVRSNLLPPQPLLCPNGIYKLMCKCLSDIPNLRPTIKQIYEQLNLYSGQCSSFLDHHLCSLANTNFCEAADNQLNNNGARLVAVQQSSNGVASMSTGAQNSITKTKSYANIRNFSHSSNKTQNQSTYDNIIIPIALDSVPRARLDTHKIPLSKSINLAGNRSLISTLGRNQRTSRFNDETVCNNHYDQPIVEIQKMKRN